MAQAARDLDVAESVLRRWMRELAATPAAAFPGNGQMWAGRAGSPRARNYDDVRLVPVS